MIDAIKKEQLMKQNISNFRNQVKSNMHFPRLVLKALAVTFVVIFSANIKWTSANAHSEPSATPAVTSANPSGTAQKIAGAPTAHGTPTSAATATLVATAPSPFLKNIRQMTFDGPRAGEGYFNTDGSLMIYQSEREPNNPFYQMYLKNMVTKENIRVSPGQGKTTCGWIAANNKWIIFSSTHSDSKSKDLEKAENDFRASGKQRRYSWDYDENYEIYKAELKSTNTKGAISVSKKLVNLTKTKGYDAEGAVSPDNKHIVFASNRSAYDHVLTPKEKEIFDKNPSYFMDIYLMNADGSGVKQLTHSPGYDGGPFFSPDGKRIVWRRFSEDGMTAEVFTMNTDGTGKNADEKQITKLGAMSWAPFYHPSGDYLIFTSSVYGHQNFELFIVDTEAKEAPVRVTQMDGFDGLPVFTPDGNKLVWNHKYTATESQMVVAEWNDFAARKALKLAPRPPTVASSTAAISEADLKTTIQFLVSKELRGRGTGTEGEQKTVTAVSNFFKDLGLVPVAKSFAQEFPFQKDAVLGSKNELAVIHNAGEKIKSAVTNAENIVTEKLKLEESWRPMAFSTSSEVPASAVVFAGYGIKAPGEQNVLPYNSYNGLDVKDKWVMVFRYLPEKISMERKTYLQPYARLEFKASLAHDLGARGIIYVNGPTSNMKLSLIPFKRATTTNIGISAVTISNEMAAQLISMQQKDLKTLQEDLDLEKPVDGFEIQGFKLSAQIEIQNITGLGHNTLGLLKVPGATRTLIIGAHGDHLGDETSDNSLRTVTDLDPIHYGADDNASGVSAVLELAQYFKNKQNKHQLNIKQNILFVVWSGEELGTLGSQFFVRNLKSLKLNSQPIRPSSYINMDMIGRWKLDPLTGSYVPLQVQGIASSPQWKKWIEELDLDAPVQLQNDPYLPTDSMALYIGKIPTINFFTGVHSDYHTPRDTEDKINYPGVAKVTQIVAQLAEVAAAKDLAPEFFDAPRSATELRRGFRIFLGTIPDYGQENIKGVRLSGVISGGPAEKAGLRGGDVIIEFSKKKIDNIHDYVYALETLRPNEKTKIIVLREGKTESLDITPQAKE